MAKYLYIKQVSRRRLLSFGAAAIALPLLGRVLPVSANTTIPQDIHFITLYQDTPVGEHTITFRKKGDSLVVTTHIEVLIKVWLITAYQYMHDAEEVWQSGQLMSVNSTTNDDGVRYNVSGQVVKNGFRVSSTNGPYLAAPALMTSNSIWDKRLMEQNTMIDVQHGGVTGLVIKSLGQEQVDTPLGPVMANRYQIITPQYAGTLFFNNKGRWIKGLIEQQGEILEYVLNA